MKIIKLFYGRTSTQEQDLTRQINWANSYGIDTIHQYLDKQTGKNFDRPKYKALLEDIRKYQALEHKIELYIMEIDRIGRNKELTLKEIQKLRKQGVVLRIGNIPQTLSNDTNDMMTEMIQNIMLEIYTTMAQLEIDNKKQRQQTAYESLEKDHLGRMISAKKGVVVGRPNKQENLSKEQKGIVQAWINKTIKLKSCIKLTGLSQATLYRIKKDWN